MKTKNGITSILQKIYCWIDWQCVGAVLTAFLVTRIMIVVITYFSMVQIPVLEGETFWHYSLKNIIPDGLMRWDSGWYISIASHGYFQKQATAFFPLFPLMIRLTSLVTGNLYTSGLYVSNLFFLVSLFFLYAFARDEYESKTAARLVFYIACVPAAFFFSTVYSESLFFLLLTSTLYFSRKGNWFFAALSGALATATRFSGIFISVFILLESLWLVGIRLFPKPWSVKAQFEILLADIKNIPNAWKGILASIFSTAGLLVYMGYLQVTFNDPFAFLHAESDWGRQLSWDWLPKFINYIYNFHYITGNLLSGEISNFAYLADTLAVFIFLPLVIIVLFRMRYSLGIYTLLSFLAPILTGQTYSMQRYTLTLIPCYLLLSLWGKRPWVDRAIIGFSLPLQAYWIILFSHYYWAG